MSGFAHARLTDPETSHAAAASIDRLTDRQGAVLRVFKRNRFAMTDVSLCSMYDVAARKGLVPAQSVSGIRTRRAELVDRGLIVDTGNRVRLASGRKAIVWALA
jgi:hypothetical protein